ncbi:MAG: hypothetical protein A3G24_28770 [Betaproteobacteria bacterium RIFCSPLOWO2_12_FULL_62_13]|nr:MAG: hypothetical protein A3G24_28770 [Betaproteobacteria bacterium RIFCSPLOWO2_12_FULL_62_13]
MGGVTPATLLTLPAHRVEAVATAAPAQAPGFDERAALRLSQSAVGKPVGEHVLTDRTGRRLSFTAYRGKPVLVNFVYTGCSHVCPTATRFLAQAVGEAERALGAQNFAVLTIGFNLPFDSPQAMADFARRHGVDRPNWEFVSPSAGGVARLTRDFGFSFVPNSGGFDHITQVSIVDAEGKIHRQVYGENFDLPFLIEPLRELVTGTPMEGLNWTQALDRIRILCTVYDPASGKYRIDYALFIEILTGLSVFGGALLFLRSGRNRRHAIRRS